MSPTVREPIDIGLVATTTWRLEEDQNRRGSTQLFALVSWQVWKGRNAQLFHGETSMINQVLLKICQEGELWIEAGATKLGCLVHT